MRKSEIAYKVVSILGKRAMRSAMIFGGAQVSYVFGKWAKHVPGTPLFVFDTLDHAQRYAVSCDTTSRLMVCRCKAVGLRRVPTQLLRLSFLVFARREELVRFWSRPDQADDWINEYIYPKWDGAMVADEIMPLRGWFGDNEGGIDGK